MENKILFNKNKYCVLKNALSIEVCREIESQILSRTPGTFNRYGDRIFDNLLINLIPTIEKNTGLKVFPTYSYFRIYKNSDELKPHIDRESCEISVSLCIGYNYDDSYGSWPLFIEDKPFYMKPGDMVIYKGIELTHSRKKFVAKDEEYHIQVFLHYVDRHGPYSEWKYDKRSKI